MIVELRVYVAGVPAGDRADDWADDWAGDGAGGHGAGSCGEPGEPRGPNDPTGEPRLWLELRLPGAAEFAGAPADASFSSRPGRPR